LAIAAKQGRFHYQAKEDPHLQERIHDVFPSCGLEMVKVVSTAVTDDVAAHAALALKDLLHERFKTESEIHIGFAGGRTLRRVAQSFAEVLRDPPVEFPKKFVFHALVAGWNVADPTNDPNAFFANFTGDSRIAVETAFVGLHGPGIVESDCYDMIRGISCTRKAFDERDKIQVLVTSAGRWSCGHSALYNLFDEYCKETLGRLKGLEIVGDMMWCPLGIDGPIDFQKINAKFRTLVLMEIAELHKFIRKGGRVLLVLGPCSGCREPKSEILEAILDLGSRQRLATHLVCDSRTARQLHGVDLSKK